MNAIAIIGVQTRAETKMDYRTAIIIDATSEIMNWAAFVAQSNTDPVYCVREGPVKLGCGNTCRMTNG